MTIITTWTTKMHCLSSPLQVQVNQSI